MALRELALRFVADETEEDLLEYLRERTVGHVWETAERVMATVTGARGDEAVVHRAARIAARMKTTLEVVLVTEGERTGRLAERLTELASVAASVGAASTELTADDAETAVVDLATRHQVTQLVPVGAASRRGSSRADAAGDCSGCSRSRRHTGSTST